MKKLFFALIPVLVFLIAAKTTCAAPRYIFPTFPPCFPFCISPTASPQPSPTNTATPTPLPTSVVTPTLTQQPPQQSKLYWGAYVGDGVSSLSNVTAFESQANKKLGIVMWYQGWKVPDDTKNFQPTWMNNVRNHGSIPMITWESWDYTKGINQPEYSLSSIINGNHDAYIRKFAQDSKAWGHPFFLRFDHEMNGNWYPWSEQVNGNSAGQYVQAYRHVHDIFDQEGVTNVSWVWSVNVIGGSAVSIESLYPGDNYVDWVAMDGYNGGTALNWGGWLTFTQVFQTTYQHLTALTTKPVMVSETASAERGGNKASWITSAYGNEIDSMNRIKAIIWFNANKETDWRINSTTRSRNAFRTAIGNQKYCSNDFTNLNSNP